jgi:hypothetical protein
MSELEIQYYSFNEEERTPVYKEVTEEVWDEQLEEYDGRYICSSCESVNIQPITDGPSGECYHCEESDYWDLDAIRIDGRFVKHDQAIKILEHRGLIRKTTTTKLIGYKVKGEWTQENSL